MNSVLRTVDLSTEVLAPVIVGAVMTSAGLEVGGLVIAGWNVGSLVVELGIWVSVLVGGVEGCNEHDRYFKLTWDTFGTICCSST